MNDKRVTRYCLYCYGRTPVEKGCDSVVDGKQGWFCFECQGWRNDANTV